jgi:PadR family transcriptional regulator, regulatory protein AphA
MQAESKLTTTSYATLGLLSLRSWTTYELAEQMQRALGLFWPRAVSGLYEEPKKLVTAGLARASADDVGRRRRTRYSITARGRRALTSWVGTSGQGPVVEFEQLVKVFFAEHGSKEDLLRIIDGV